MIERRFSWVDAFTQTPLHGNACAVVFDANGLSDDQMLAITREMKQAETAFVFNHQDGEFRLRLFTCEKEIPLAGHPTLAVVQAALDRGIIERKKESPVTRIRLHLIGGPVSVNIEASGKIAMTQRKPEFFEIHSKAQVAHCFGLTLADICDHVPVQCVSTGTRQLMVPLKNLEALKKVKLNDAAYRELRAQSGFFSPHLFCQPGFTSQGHTFARHPGTDGEDAFTGSATGAMAAFLYHYGLVATREFVAEQGHLMGRPGQAWVQMTGQPDSIESVSVAGFAVTLVSGVIYV